MIIEHVFVIHALLITNINDNYCILNEEQHPRCLHTLKVIDWLEYLTIELEVDTDNLHFKSIY